MVCRKEISTFCNPGQGLCLQADDRLSIHSRWRLKPASQQEANHLIPHLNDSYPLAGLTADSVFVLERIPAILDYDFWKRTVEIVAPDVKAGIMDVYAVEYENLLEINYRLTERLLACRVLSADCFA